MTPSCKSATAALELSVVVHKSGFLKLINLSKLENFSMFKHTQSANKASHFDFETQRLPHQKSPEAQNRFKSAQISSPPSRN